MSLSRSSSASAAPRSAARSPISAISAPSSSNAAAGCPKAGFADLVALCQFMPGPASSQLGMAIGLLRAGPLGMLAAWVGFTLPSALLMLAFAYGVEALGDVSNAAWLKGLKLVAVAVVAQAVWGMAQSLAPDRPRATLAVAAALIALAVPSSFGQIGAIVLGAIIGLTLLPKPAAHRRRTTMCRSASTCIAASLCWRSSCSSRCCCSCRRSPPRSTARRCGCSTRSIAPARWCSAAAMWCCRCCRPRWCRRAGSATTRSSRATVRRRRCRARCSPSPPISVR